MTLPEDVQRVVVSCYLYAFQFIPGVFLSFVQMKGPYN